MEPQFQFDKLPQYVRDATELVIVELIKATNEHGPLASAHEGYAVIKEELDELWDEIKKQQHKRSRMRMAEEAAQVAAMAIRFLLDVSGSPEEA